jgi:hypothetical protein
MVLHTCSLIQVGIITKKHEHLNIAYTCICLFWLQERELWHTYIVTSHLDYSLLNAMTADPCGELNMVICDRFGWGCADQLLCMLELIKRVGWAMPFPYQMDSRDDPWNCDEVKLSIYIYIRMCIYIYHISLVFFNNIVLSIDYNL